MKNYILIPLLTLLTTGLRAQENKSYRPFVEDGKVWTIGCFSKPRWYLEQLEYYYFDGDTLINHQPCKRMMSRMSDEKVPSYQGAFYEKDRRVYCCFPNSEDFYLLYDYGAEVGDTIKVYAPSVKDMVTLIADYRTGGSSIFKFKSDALWVIVESSLYDDKEDEYDDALWVEGVGTYEIPIHSVLSQDTETCWFRLIACTVDDEVLFQSTYLYFQGIYWEDLVPEDATSPSDDKSNPKKPKQKIDFTHVIKKQPKREGETVVGSFTGDRLFVNMGKLYDLYTVTITDSIGQVVYTKQVMTDNVLALNIDISDLPYSDYTVTVENDEYIFTGRFFCSPPYDYDGDGVLTVNDITMVIKMYLDDEGEINIITIITATIDAYLDAQP